MGGFGEYFREFFWSSAGNFLGEFFRQFSKILIAGVVLMGFLRGYGRFCRIFRKFGGISPDEP